MAKPTSIRKRPEDSPGRHRQPNRALHPLQRVLHRAGKPTRQLDFADGTRLLLLPHGGRVIGLFESASNENFLWTHPVLASVGSARRLFGNSRWPNPGGDRTWLAPSSELFVADVRRVWATYREPVALDPGHYRCEWRSRAWWLVNRARLKLFRSGGTALVEISKRFSPAANPLRYERGLASRVRYAGYTTTQSLRIISNPKGAQLGLWPLLQLRPGGEMLLPTYHRARPSTLFGQVPRSDLRVTERLVRYRMGGRTTAKIAVRAVATAGRVGYISPISRGRWELVVRNFFVNPSGEYVDTPFEDLSDRGYSFQACYVAESSLGSFSELEYHVPAAESHPRCNPATDESQTWAFRGTRAAILKVGAILLGATWSLLRHSGKFLTSNQTLPS